MTLSPQTRLGTYVILAPLGAGGMGVVYRARDLRLGREIAIKVLPAALASSPERLERLEREARAVAALNHPNIVTLHSLEDEDGIRFLTMELVEGETLTSKVAPDGLPLQRLVQLAIPLADALVAAHEKGVIHRDLKPGNVMVTTEGRVKVLDFGLAKIAGESGEAGRPANHNETMTMGSRQDSASSQPQGTLPYMSPEQVRGDVVDARSDLFAFGIILYELAIGRRPFQGNSSADISSSILRDEPPLLRDIRSDLPRDLGRIVARCLEKNARDRFQTARDVYQELRYLEREMGLATAHAGRTGVPDARAAAAPAAREVASIAVLPFVNRGKSEDDDYFSDGLADELLNMLAKIRGLKVIARTSSLRFKGSTEDPAIIGAKLNASTLLDGTVRKSGSRVRITVQLVRAKDGVQIWSESYDRSLEDIFSVQEEIARAVVKELRAALLGETPDSEASGRAQAEVAAAAAGRSHNLEAHRLYLQGKHLLDRLTPADTIRGLEYLNQAVAADPANANAWLEVSRGYGICAGYAWGPPLDVARRLTREAVERALALDPDSAEALARLANVQLWIEWDWKGAEQSLRRALEISPNSDAAIRSAGSLALALGRLADAEALYQRSVDLDPLNSFGYHYLADIYRYTGRLEDAERAERKVLEISPQRSIAHSNLALILLARGLGDEALAEAAREAPGLFRELAFAIIHHALGRQVESNAHMDAMIKGFADTGAYQIAQAYAVRGEKDRAFEWLDRAVAQRDAGLIYLKCDDRVRSLANDPRWGILLRRLRLDE